MRLGIALEGGGVRCMAQAGVLHALYDAGVRPALYAGCGAGAIVAGLAASERLTQEIALLFAGSAHQNAALRSASMNRRLRSVFGGMTLRDCQPMAVPTVDMETGVTQVLASILPICPDPRPWSRQALVSSAVRAAIAAPGVLPPMGWRGHRLSGGGFLRDTLPSLLRAMGADRTIVIRVLDAGCAQHETHPTALALCAHALASSAQSTSDLIIPVCGYVKGKGVLDRSAADAYYQAGRLAGIKSLPALKALTGSPCGKIILFPLVDGHIR